MVAPTLSSDVEGRKLDTIYSSAGDAFLKIAIGDVDNGLTPHVAWQGVATHMEGDSLVAGDGVMLLAGVDGGVGGDIVPVAVDSFGRVSVRPTSAGGVLIDGSGTLTTGGTSDTVLAANPARVYLLVQNVDPAETMWLDFDQDAVTGQPSFMIPAGGSFVMEAGFVHTGDVRIVAATTAHPFSIREA